MVRDFSARSIVLVDSSYPRKLSSAESSASASLEDCVHRIRTPMTTPDNAKTIQSASEPAGNRPSRSSSRFYCNRIQAGRTQAAVSGAVTAFVAVATYFLVLRGLGIPSWVGLPLAAALVGAVSLEVSLGCHMVVEATGLRMQWRTHEEFVPYDGMTIGSQSLGFSIMTSSRGSFLVRAPWWRPDRGTSVEELRAEIMARMHGA